MMQRSLQSSTLTCLLLWAWAGPAAAQPGDAKGKPAPNQPVQLKGNARMSTHAVKMEQGTIYRLSVTAEGFIPEVAIDEQRQTFITSSPPPQGQPQPLPAPSKTARMYFEPPTTKVYVIKVGHLPLNDVAQGPLPYTLTLERAKFKPAAAAKEGKLEVSEQSRKLEQGKTYGFTVTGKGFAPEIQVMDGNQTVANSSNGRWYGFGPDQEFVNSFSFTPGRSTDFRIVVSVGTQVPERQAALTYTVQVAELKALLSVNEALTKEDALDPRRGGPAKVHTVALQAGKKYQIDMISQAFDSYLFLEDSAGTLIMEDDDSGGNLNARIIFQPTKTGTYRIVATTFNPGVTAKSLGAFQLTVVENSSTQLLPPVPFPTKKN